MDDASLGQVLDAVGPRLRELRQQRGVTPAQLSETTGISVSTLSRLESGGRRPTLELLLPIAEFDTHVPHWFGNPGPEPAEVISLYGPQGERMRVRTRPKH